MVGSHLQSFGFASDEQPTERSQLGDVAGRSVLALGGMMRYPAFYSLQSKIKLLQQFTIGRDQMGNQSDHEGERAKHDAQRCQNQGLDMPSTFACGKQYQVTDAYSNTNCAERRANPDE